MESGNFFQVIRLIIASIGLTVVLTVLLATVVIKPSVIRSISLPDWTKGKGKDQAIWVAPDSTLIPNSAEGDLIRYGRDLVSHTSAFLGPNGKVMPVTNGMNCQNCHLDGGKKPFGNNYAAVSSTYPKFRARSGSMESIEKRVNDCVERSLNGMTLDDSSREMRGLVSYIQWLGKNVRKGDSPKGSGIQELPLMVRAADPVKGKKIYTMQCTRCHGESGAGLRHENGVEWKYPPVWGDDSYNIGAGLFRISRLAGYVKFNMPNDLPLGMVALTDEEAWDVAAFINSMPRPTKDISRDWPDIAAKPFDHPFGPYVDGFSETQHKYGPFPPILEAQKK